MTNFNPLYDTLSAPGIVAGYWDAKPPAQIDLVADYTLNNIAMRSSTSSGALAVKMNQLDNIYIKNAGVFCNFADGLLFTPTTRLYLNIGFDIVAAAPTYPMGKLWIPIPALNVMFDVNRFLPSWDASAVLKSWFADAANFDPAVDKIYIWSKITTENAAGGKFATGAVNPDLADDGTNLPLGCTGIRFDAIATAQHMFELTA
jgi:hypothetical protein